MLPDAVRYKLHFGPYRAPRIELGAIIADEMRGDVKVVGLTDARIPWPVALNWAQRSLVVYADLVRAIRLESVQAVAYWWGISVEKVRLIRRALDVPDFNEGTMRLHRRYAQTPDFRRKVRKAWANAGSPERRESNRRAHLGQIHSERTKRKIRAASRGRVPSPATRRKISEALKRNGTWRRWTAKEDAVVLSADTYEAAKRTGRSVKAIHHRRILLRSAKASAGTGH